MRKHWTLEVARKARLLVSDSPLVVWRKPSPRDEYEGVGVESADELRFPLDSGKQLVLSATDRPFIREIEPARVRSCNADMAAGCHRFVVGHPDRVKQLEDLALAANRPVVRFNTGPGYEQRADGSSVYMGEVLHMWVPRR